MIKKMVSCVSMLIMLLPATAQKPANFFNTKLANGL